MLGHGPTKTPGPVGLAGPDQAQQQGLLDYLAASVPLGLVGDPEEIAQVALFLASDESSFVAGADFFADGGKAQVKAKQGSARTAPGPSMMSSLSYRPRPADTSKLRLYQGALIRTRMPIRAVR